ncbi:MAG: hypothetical protein V4754_09305 [Pseudomonadota bacterium]
MDMAIRFDLSCQLQTFSKENTPSNRHGKSKSNRKGDGLQRETPRRAGRRLVQRRREPDRKRFQKHICLSISAVTGDGMNKVGGEIEICQPCRAALIEMII